MEEPKLMNLDVMVERHVINLQTEETFPIVFQDDEIVIILYPNGSTERIQKEFMSDGED